MQRGRGNIHRAKTYRRRPTAVLSLPKGGAQGERDFKSQFSVITEKPSTILLNPV